MKKILFTLILLLLVSVFAFAQTDSEVNRKEIAELNAEISQSVKIKDYSKALKAAQKAVKFTETAFGKDHLESGKALLTLGFVYLLADKYNDAEDYLKQALVIYDSNKTENDPMLIILLETLSLAKYRTDKYEESAVLLERATKMREKTEGSDSSKVITNFWSLANLNFTVGKFRTAADLYRRVFDYRYAQKTVNSPELYDAFIRCSCSLYKADNPAGAERFESLFKAKVEEKTNYENFDIINGKAKKLPRPEYPALAALRKTTGKAEVTVIIDEQGNVVFACTKVYTGSEQFVDAAEKAAYKAKFASTTVNGKPIRVSGIIVYNFKL